MKIKHLLASTISRIIPESKFKEIVREYFYGNSDPLFLLNKLISKVNLLTDGTVYVEFNNGIKYFGLKEGTELKRTKYLDYRRFDKIKELGQYQSMLGMLQEQYVTNSYEKHYNLKEGDIVVDAGAHIGLFTIKASKIIGVRGRVIAIEPEAQNLFLLKKNIDINKLDNVIVVEKGIWDKRDTLMMKLFGDSTSLSSFHGNQFPGAERPTGFAEIVVDTLDDILIELGVKHVDFVKMDIEGAEVEALKGMEKTLDNNNIKLAGEYHIVDGKPAYSAIAVILRARGFEVHREGQYFYAVKK